MKQARVWYKGAVMSGHNPFPIGSPVAPTTYLVLGEDEDAQFYKAIIRKGNNIKPGTDKTFVLRPACNMQSNIERKLFTSEKYLPYCLSDPEITEL